ncbi:MAG: serine/threonine protein kinase [Phycisphaeraceae bacterium]|nr:serine/threonine protein kinase [Phycisphaeraceae bacterium]
MACPEDFSSARDGPSSDPRSRDGDGVCPGLEALEEYASALATGEPCTDHHATMEHVRSCGTCADLLSAMRSAEGFLDRFRGPVARSRDEVERGLKPEHQRAMEGASPVVVEGYSVEGLVAFGGQGAVYKAVQRGTGRLVAIKLPLGDTQRHPSTRYRFEREVELAARLDHPGIVRIIEACRVEDGRLGYVMEYVEGETIDRWSMRTRADGAAGMRRIVAVMAEVADAIAAAHQRAVLHRDIKPSNVIVAGDGRARVLDFGLAKSLDASGSSFVTMTGAFLGTLAYAAPEQIDGGAEAVDIRTDVYAMGLVLFLCLTGRLPYATDVPTTELLRQIRESDPVRPSTVVGQVPADLDAIVLKALAKVRERRYTTAGEFRDDLRAWLAGQAVRARFDSRWYVARKTIRRHRRVVAAALATGLFAITFVGLSAYTIASTDAAKARESYERNRATTESAKANAVQQLIDELLPIASIDTGNPLAAASVQSLNLLDRKLETGHFRDQPMLEAAVRGLLATIYDDRGTLGRAEPMATCARLHQLTLGDGHLRLLALRTHSRASSCNASSSRRQRCGRNLHILRERKFCPLPTTTCCRVCIHSLVSNSRGADWQPPEPSFTRSRRRGVSLSTLTPHSRYP